MKMVDGQTKYDSGAITYYKAEQVMPFLFYICGRQAVQTKVSFTFASCYAYQHLNTKGTFIFENGAGKV